MSTYLSVRKRPAGGFSFYAVTNYWNAAQKVLEKDQVYIGALLEKGYKFNQRAMEYAPLFKGTEYEDGYWAWRNEKGNPKGSEFMVPRYQIEHESSTYIGLSLLLDKVVKELGLGTVLEKAYGKILSDRILSLAYYCASQIRRSLFESVDWGRDRQLPGGTVLSLDLINKTLQNMDRSAAYTFKDLWKKKHLGIDPLYLSIKPIDSVHRNNEEVALGMFRYLESLKPPRALATIDRTTQNPVYYELLPTDEPDITTINNILNSLGDWGALPGNVVFDKDFSRYQNIRYLLKNNVNFIIGVSFNNLPAYRMEIDSLKGKEGFKKYDQMLEIFQRDEILKTQAVTKVHQLEGHTVYLHYYYIGEYRNRTAARFKDRVDRVQKKLEQGMLLYNTDDQKLADKYFSVQISSEDGRTVKQKHAIINRKIQDSTGYFAVMSNHLKDPGDVLKAYKIREGFEDRFDDLKREEDFYRLNIYSYEMERARIVIQFVAQIIRLYMLDKLHRWEDKPAKIQSLTEMLWIISPLKRIDISGHEPFYQPADDVQQAILDRFGITYPPEKHQKTNKLG